LIWTAEDPTQKSSTHVGAWRVSFWALCTLAPGSSTLKKLIPTCWLHFHTTLRRFCVMNCFRVLHSCNPSYSTIVQSSRQLLNQQVVMPKHQSKLQEFSLLSIEQKVTRRLSNRVSSEGLRYRVLHPVAGCMQWCNLHYSMIGNTSHVERTA
jgi:hypothetical protein